MSETPERGLLTKICRGEASLALNCLLWPFVLVANAIWVYVLPCFSVIGDRTFRLFCYPFFSCCWVYTDKDFSGEAAVGTGDPVDWVRAGELATEGKKMHIYEGGIEPKDLCQGAVGDCWLVAALASAAEHPACIRNAFLTSEANPRGKYRVRLYDGQAKRWVTVVIDDLIPCVKGTKRPIFMKAHGNELWAILLEKAFAKFCGSYEALDGGWALWGWLALTGDNVFSLSAKDGGKSWQRENFKCQQNPKDKRAAGFYRTKEEYKPDAVRRSR